MRRRYVRMAWACSAVALLSILGAAPARGDGADRSTPTPTPKVPTETVTVFDAKKAGDLGVEVRGHGGSSVRMVLKNASGRRLNVVLPAGLVAASTTAQGPGGLGGGGGGGLQSMGLGVPGNVEGGFGAFGTRAPNQSGFRSVGPARQADPTAVVVPAGQTMEFLLPAVCLNYGLPSPKATDKLTLVDVDDFTRDTRVRKALRSVVSMGTSRGTAQAAMWNICNGVPFAAMAEMGEKTFNRYELALAARFVSAVDGSTSSDLVDPTYLTDSRLFVAITGAKGFEKDARRLADEIDGLRVLGLPLKVVDAQEMPRAAFPAIHLRVDLAETRSGEATGKILVRFATGFEADGVWSRLGQVNLKTTGSAGSLRGDDLARSLDRSVSSAFVSARPIRKDGDTTVVKIENRLPFTLANVILKPSGATGSTGISFDGLGIAPVGTGKVSIPAGEISLDRVELNGL